MIFAEVKELLAAEERRYRDAVEWHSAGAAKLRPAYDQAVTERPASPENHQRALELFPLVAGSEQEARDAKKHAEDIYNVSFYLTTLYMQYLGVVGLLANVLVHAEEDDRQAGEEAFKGAMVLVPNLKVKRILNSFHVDLESEQ